jgi:hypothetical protein
MAQPSQTELQAKIDAAAERRKAKQAASKDAAALLRLENEARIGDIEDATGLTLGVDMGVVWCPDGQMVLVRRPSQLSHEKYNLQAMQKDVTAQMLDEFVRPPTVVYPEAGKLEAVWQACPGAKIAVANVASRLAEVTSAGLEGK